MLEEFIRKHDVDIAMLQEVTSVHNITIKGYQTIDNFEIAGRGTAILTKDDLQMHRIKTTTLRPSTNCLLQQNMSRKHLRAIRNIESG